MYKNNPRVSKKLTTDIFYFRRIIFPSQIAIASCNSFQKRNKRGRLALAHGRRGEAPSGGSQRCGPLQAGQGD